MNRIERMKRVDSDERPAGRPRRSLGAVALIAGVSLASLVGVAPATVSAAPARPSAPACSNGSYTVVRGDGWSIIARKLGVTTKALLAANGATTATVIHPGRSICVPAGATTSTTSTSSASSGSSSGSTSTKTASCANGTYTVVKGDGWLAIAKKVGATSKALLAANNATTSTALFPGRSICLPAGATPSGSTAAGTTATVAVRAYTAAENEAIIRSVWPDELEEEALRIARRESNLKYNAKNSCCYGLFQINWSAHKSWLAGIGVTSASQLLDPNVNTAAAYTLYQRSGSFRPWAL
ncbi:MAG: LysM peptidoglycan-binding domain-containing protein [Actinobacteria bacterium]|nr:LysM peptidoglycan-binding domain-containing protein [Actinomycetota bacterium]